MLVFHSFWTISYLYWFRYEQRVNIIWTKSCSYFVHYKQHMNIIWATSCSVWTTYEQSMDNIMFIFCPIWQTYEHNMNKITSQFLKYEEHLIMIWATSCSILFNMNNIWTTYEQHMNNIWTTDEYDVNMKFANHSTTSTLQNVQLYRNHSRTCTLQNTMFIYEAAIQDGFASLTFHTPELAAACIQRTDVFVGHSKCLIFRQHNINIEENKVDSTTHVNFDININSTTKRML